MFILKKSFRDSNFKKLINLLYRKNKINNLALENKNENFDIQKFDSKTKEFINSFKLYDEFIDEKEEDSLIKKVDELMIKRKYEDSHWDFAAEKYRELEFSDWSEKNSKIFKKIYNLAFSDKLDRILPKVHILDLSKNGFLKPHVDSIKFCGETITGLSLNSDSVMRLKHTEDKEFIVNILLKQRSLYIMEHFSRYQFTHEILKEDESYFKNKKIIRKRRISLMCRCFPKIECDLN